MTDLFGPYVACPIKTRQRWLRIRVSACAYAYEILNDPIMSDAEYDVLALQIDPNVSTLDYWQRPVAKRIQKLDDFFREHYSPYTGQWVCNHPELDRLDRVVRLTRDSYK